MIGTSQYRFIIKSRCSCVSWSTGRSVAMLQLHDATVGRNVGPSTCRTLWYFRKCPRTSASLSHLLASSANIILGFLGIFHPGTNWAKSLSHDSRTLCWCNFGPLPLWQLNPRQGKKESWGPDTNRWQQEKGRLQGLELKSLWTLLGPSFCPYFFMISFALIFDSLISWSTGLSRQFDSWFNIIISWKGQKKVVVKRQVCTISSGHNLTLS